MKKPHNHKPNLWLRKWAKTHLQQSRNSKLSGEGPPHPPCGGLGGEGRAGERKEGKGGEGLAPLREKILSTPLHTSAFYFYLFKS